jgi:hypothetical protein
MKSVIIYTYYDTKIANYNLSFFIKKELSYKNNIDYIFVINGFNINSSIQIPELNNVTIIRRENVGFDFGGHKAALDYIEKNNKKYDFYFFLNSGVIGPILPHYFVDKHWTNIFIKKINNRVKLVGTSIVCLPHNDLGGYGPKVEGFFFMTDKIGLNLLKNENTIFYNHPDFHSAIVNGEYAISRCIFKHGYTIDCMIRKYQKIDWKNKNNYNLNNNKHPTRNNSFYNNSLNPYELIFHKVYWKDSEPVNLNIIEQIINNNT